MKTEMLMGLTSAAFHTVMQFILDNVVIAFVYSFFTVVGGAIPIAVLIYFFARQEKERLVAHAEAIKATLPLQEQLLDRMAKLIQSSITHNNVGESADSFKQLIEAQNLVEENKKFIKYANSYNFISALGQMLRMSNYMPKNLGEHKEFSKDTL